MDREKKILSLLDEFKQLSIDQQIDYNKFYLYSLITHSTAIEGSTVTEIENQLLFDEGISAKGRPISEQFMNIDLKSAYEQSIKFAKNKKDITIETLKQLASIVMKNTGSEYNTVLGNFSSTNGDLRLLNVTAGYGGRSYMNFTKVPAKLSEFCDMVNSRRKTISKENIIEAYRLSFDAHFLLVTVHPWVDGNGRMSRLLMNQLQFEFGIVPTKINKDSKAQYIETLVATRENDDIEIFRSFMFNEHIKNLEQIISEYKTSIDNSDISINVPANAPINVPIKFTDREAKIINAMKGNKSITIQDLAQLLDVNEKTIKRDIFSLKAKGNLERIGSNKSGEWKVID